MDVRDEKRGLGFSTNFSQTEQPKVNISIKPSKIRFNFGNKTNMPIKTNRIHFAEGKDFHTCKYILVLFNLKLIGNLIYKYFSIFYHRNELFYCFEMMTIIMFIIIIILFFYVLQCKLQLKFVTDETSEEEK